MRERVMLLVVLTAVAVFALKGRIPSAAQEAAPSLPQHAVVVEGMPANLTPAEAGLVESLYGDEPTVFAHNTTLEAIKANVATPEELGDEGPSLWTWVDKVGTYLDGEIQIQVKEGQIIILKNNTVEGGDSWDSATFRISNECLVAQLLMGLTYTPEQVDESCAHLDAQRARRAQEWRDSQ